MKARMRSGAFVTALFIAAAAAVFAPAFCFAFTLPANLGKVIYSWNANSPRIIYVIGTSHKDAVAMKDGPDTVKAQAEVYKIGQYLAQSGVHLLLPEGFFQLSGTALNEKIASPAKTPAQAQAMDTGKNLPGKTIAKFVLNPDVYVNAEMLIEKHLGFILAQVEDLDLYKKELGILEQSGQPDYFTMLNLQYLQRMRTACMLQKAPEVTDKDCSDGLIKTNGAIMTVGLAHLKELIGFLEKGRINIEAPLFAPADYRDYSAGLNVSRLGYGVVVIVPAGLASDRAVLQATGLAALNK
ncbi:MAG: hypothetical protein M0Z52_01275 [Actinomycetota bacterium]|nr:hypothetical protein [Actinomycetota bacterium]